MPSHDVSNPAEVLHDYVRYEVDKDEEEKTPEEYRKNWTAVCKEVFALLVLNFLSNMMFLVPIWVTGKLLYIKQ